MVESSGAPLMPPIRQWRGRSGRLYRADIVGITEAACGAIPDGLGLAVARERGLAVQVIRPAPRITAAWLAQARGAQACEIHVVALPVAEIADAVADLRVTR